MIELRVVLLWAIALYAASSSVRSEELEAGSTRFIFATEDVGQKLIGASDDFTRRLSGFDIAVRMRREKPASDEEFLKFLRAEVVAWDPRERELLTAAFEAVRPELEKLDLSLPSKVFLVKTSGKEEPGSAYTRGNAIYFHPGALRSDPGLQRLLAHELFHLLSRRNPELRNRLYAVIGFSPCGEIAMPKSLQPRKITNPDAPINGHAIGVKIGGQARHAVPILVAKSDFDPESDRTLFDYLDLRFLVIKKNAKGTWAPIEKDGAPISVGVIRLSNFFEQIGRNTGYVIHPEEILADNFAHLVMGKKEVPNPEIIEKMRTVFADSKREAATR